MSRDHQSRDHHGTTVELENISAGAASMSHAGPLWSIERAAGTHPHNGLEASGNIRRALRIGRNLGLSASLPHPCTGAWPAEKALRPTRGQQRKPCGPRAAEKALRPTRGLQGKSCSPRTRAAWLRGSQSSEAESPQPTPRGFRSPRSPRRVGSGVPGTHAPRNAWVRSHPPNPRVFGVSFSRGLLADSPRLLVFLEFQSSSMRVHCARPACLRVPRRTSGRGSASASARQGVGLTCARTRARAIASRPPRPLRPGVLSRGVLYLLRADPSTSDARRGRGSRLDWGSLCRKVHAREGLWLR